MIDRRFFLGFAAFLSMLAIWIKPAPAASFDAEIAAAAKAWIAAMGDKAKKARFEFKNDERFDWHFTPRSREGLRPRDMDAAQRDATKKLMRSTLSSGGILKAEAIMALEKVLGELEGSSTSFRDPENYLISIFGEPGGYPWGWRLEGHHLSINVTVAATGAVSVTPAFTGTNPARIPSGPRAGSRIQHDEFVLALRLAGSLTETQRNQATISSGALGNIVAGPGRGDALKTPEGLPVSQMTDAQRSLLLELVAAYVGLARDEIGWPYMRLVEAGLAETRFAWGGPISETQAFYYRIHGPRILIEFDNSQNDANHIHSLWRDPANDFGRDDLGRHYKDAPASQGHVHKRH